MIKKKKMVKKLKGKKVLAGMHKMPNGKMMSDKEMKNMMSGNRMGKVSHYRKS